MKKTIILTIALVAVTSCDNCNELPPLNDSYATEFIMPDPTDLTPEDRAYIEALNNEYEEAQKSK